MLVKDVVQKTTDFFKEKGFESPRLDTELLIASALNWDRVKIYLNYDYPLNEQELSKCRELVRRRAGGEPVAYILGKKDFYKHSFHVSNAVLIPRPETEEMVETVLELVNKELPEQEIRIVDLGTGSGCIGLSLLAELPLARLCGVDVSPAALEVAKLNSETLGLSDRTSLIEADAGVVAAELVRDSLGGWADVVVANPPYIAKNDPQVSESVKKFEPAGALFSDEDGLSHIRFWAKKAAEITRPRAVVIFEIGHEQGEKARELFHRLNVFDSIVIQKDLSGKDRFIRCRRSAAADSQA